MCSLDEVQAQDGNEVPGLKRLKSVLPGRFQCSSSCLCFIHAD
mgnify:CR=1 FL=1